MRHILLCLQNRKGWTEGLYLHHRWLPVCRKNKAEVIPHLKVFPSDFYCRQPLLRIVFVNPFQNILCESMCFLKPGFFQENCKVVITKLPMLIAAVRSRSNVHEAQIKNQLFFCQKPRTLLETTNYAYRARLVNE